MIKKLILSTITLLISYTATCQTGIANNDSLIPIPKAWLRGIVKDLEKKDMLEQQIVLYKNNDSLKNNKIFFQDSIISLYETNENKYQEQINAYKTSDTLQKALMLEDKNKIKEYKKERNIFRVSTALLVILFIL